LEVKTFYSNGKLLITGEYLVLEGALSLAVPTIPGHEMTVEPGMKSGTLSWESYYEDECWFEGSFSLPGLEIIKARDPKTASYLQSLLQEANKLNPEVVEENESLNIVTKLGFRPDWGLGSSSSLINNIASFFKIDPFDLFFNTQKGSAYDIACANSDSPIFYRLEDRIPQFENINFNPPFKDKLAFVYSGKKQDSEASVHQFLGQNGFYEYEKGSISGISREIQKAQSLHDFNELLNEHEEIMARVLNLPKVKEASFPDFPGSVKSLGAWGGDFLLASSEIGFEEIKAYFSAVELDVVFRWEELVLDIKF